MEYFLSRVEYMFMGVKHEITQLVKASSKEMASEALAKQFASELPNAIILEIRIHDTIIGE